jgi:RNA polymerase sigma-70 factor (ECF subfamily)
MMDEERKLVDRARGGDDQAFERLLVAALPKVLGVARRLLRNDAEGWDVAQEAFLRAWTRLAGFRGEAAFSTWVTGIAFRLALDRLAAARRADGEINENRPDDAPRPEAMAESRALAEAVDVAVRALPESERAVFLLCEEAGMRYREAAAELKIPIGTVMSRLHAARLKLRSALVPWWKEMRS